MRLDTLLLIPVTGIVLYSLISVQKQIYVVSPDNFVKCEEQRPFSYYITHSKEQSHCGWNTFQYYLIMGLFIGNLLSCLLGYLISRKFSVLMVIIGEISFGCSVYLYKKAYDAHAFCQSFIIPTLTETKKRIVCQDDAYYVVVGMLFLLSLLTIFYAVLYIIKDDHGVPLAEVSFGFAPDAPATPEEKKKEEKTD